MNRQAFDRAVKEHGTWLPAHAFLALLPATLRTPGGSAEDLADELDIIAVGGATGTRYRTEDLKAALGYL